jgi:hypothetical protein
MYFHPALLLILLFLYKTTYTYFITSMKFITFVRCISTQTAQSMRRGVFDEEKSFEVANNDNAHIVT